jgi:hypothetical protein
MRCNRQPLFHQILRVRKFAFVEVQVPLCSRDVGVPEQPAGVFDPLLPADFRGRQLAVVSGQLLRRAGRIGQVAMVEDACERAAAGTS